METSKPYRVAIALITDNEENVLMGRRHDCGLWTLPGGGIEEDEEPAEGLIREVKEETGLDIIACKLVDVKYKNDMMLYLYEVVIDSEQEVDVSEDPDQECPFWVFIDPNQVKKELYVPLEDNVGLQYWMNS